MLPKAMVICGDATDKEQMCIRDRFESILIKSNNSFILHFPQFFRKCTTVKVKVVSHLPVSYTHLDVYKRQDMDSGMYQEFSATEFVDMFPRTNGDILVHAILVWTGSR